MILNNSKIRVNLKEVEKKSKDLNSQFKMATQDTLMLQMMKDAQRVEFVSFALLKLMQSELQNKQDLRTLLNFSFKFLAQSLDVFTDIITGLPLTPQLSSRHSPFGVGRSQRDNPKKTLIKQNTQLAIGYLKKICK